MEGDMEKEIDLKKLFGVIKKRMWTVTICTVLFTALGVSYNIFLNTPPTPMYESSTKVIIKDNDAAKLSNTLIVVMKDSAILDKVIQKLGIKTSSERLSESIFVENIEESQVLKITAVYPDPILAAEIANTTANIFKEEVPNILSFGEKEEILNVLNFDEENETFNILNSEDREEVLHILNSDKFIILSEAKVNNNPLPMESTKVRNVLLAFCIGLTVGIGITFLLESFDDTLRSEQMVEQLLEVPVLGSISKVNKKILKESIKKEDLLVGGKMTDS
jgi:capsular polysaccharide biosynthesis protein